MIYAWKAASQIKADPIAAGQLFEKLEAEGALTPKNVVDRSRPEKAPLHGEFEWDDETAAELYRQRQAGHLMRCIVTVDETKKHTEGEEEAVPVRAFYPVSVVSVPRQYVSIKTVMSNQELYDNVLARAKRELRSFVEKYNTLEALAPVLEPARAFLSDEKHEEKKHDLHHHGWINQPTSGH